ncbi:hypothetical protein [Amycolatopsis sp. CA-230715]|uniref:hypothetical protein n=1 Tax=Amycolatopsis sp. CA-230715 TaxID=2745196 RepID=UPI001C02C4E3|nr:hypothetical protein [Amycolatopsis sp. CA-230715]QWF85450.1 hypothetical protein HUW46_08904 [Amycolatopsis sp. CA-230715]
MRRTRISGVTAITALAIAGLAGCADRPNDLETYYDETTPPTTTSAASDTPAAPEPPPNSVQPPVAAPSIDPATALLADPDLAEEGVRRAPDAPPAGGCLAGMPPQAASAYWRYQSGALLSQRVAAYPGGKAAEIAPTLGCAGKPVAIAPPPGADAASAWSSGSTCTMLVAKGDLLSVLSVAASSEARAIDAAKRLAPVAAGKLGGVQP